MGGQKGVTKFVLFVGAAEWKVPNLIKDDATISQLCTQSKSVI
jgi:hypothetical protein